MGSNHYVQVARALCMLAPALGSLAPSTAAAQGAPPQQGVACTAPRGMVHHQATGSTTTDCECVPNAPGHRGRHWECRTLSPGAGGPGHQGGGPLPPPELPAP